MRGKSSLWDYPEISKKIGLSLSIEQLLNLVSGRKAYVRVTQGINIPNRFGLKKSAMGRYYFPEEEDRFSETRNFKNKLNAALELLIQA